MILSISGTDTFRSYRKLESIRAKATEKGATQQIIDFAEIVLPDTPQSVLYQLKTELTHISLFTQKRLIIIRNISILSKSLYKLIKTELKILQDTPDTIILFYDRQLIHKTHPISGLLDTLQAKSEIYNPLPKNKLSIYIKQLASEQGMVLDNQAIDYLIIETKQDAYSIEMYLNYLDNYYQNQPITLSMVQKLIPEHKDHKMFLLSEYFLKKKYGQYLELLRECQNQGEEGIVIYGYMTSQIKKALIMSFAKQKGFPYTQYIKGNPYALNKLSQSINDWTSEQLQDIYYHITQGDYAIKFEGKDSFQLLKHLVYIYS